ncbi:glycosyltransferase [Comamonas piscis]|uniref:Glycosyltransferase n=1 Tax=Comamonas piscis TaxID=1562974 RepID=A0A7G5EEC3_9BURK|nr:glycosyltransferase family 2 protein [Comamonas piscis]QMV72348.1 glycosyltransferase [Comamonas piscis]WSO35115.1 glycosyltransferase family 2 protein [Comamonas piscis]
MTESPSRLYRNQRIAVILPCHNEELTVRPVVEGFRQALPEAEIYIFNNLSTDRTAEIALEVGAHLRNVNLKGKGNVVRRMFADVDADIYVMADGDATYHAPSARKLIDMLIDQQLDMVVGARVEAEPEAGDTGITYRPGHRWGNKLLTGTVQQIFGGSFRDMLSGYRVFSRRYVKSFPAHSQGFEIETELNVHALELRMPCTEVDTPYGARPEGSASKLSTYRDGWRILKTIGRLVVSEKPLQFFGWLGAALALISIALVAPIVLEYQQTGLVRRFPTLGLVSALMVCGGVSFVTGLILQAITLTRREIKQFAYLASVANTPSK